MIKLLFFLLPILSFAQHTLTVKVTDLKSSDGLIGMCIYDSEGAWLEEGETNRGVFSDATKGETIITFKDLPTGAYAISLFHDENGDKELDKNMFGIPKEPLGFSIGKLKTFGPPSFEECAFEITSDFEITIPVN